MNKTIKKAELEIRLEV